MHIDEVRRDFLGRTYSNNDYHGRVGVTRGQFKSFGNSGAGAVAMALKVGACRIVLLGYDCQRTGGKVHWHGDHPKGLGNAGSMPNWPQQFAKLAATANGVPIINCSRETALTCFPRGQLEEELAKTAP